jgi:hypothetical protein
MIVRESLGTETADELTTKWTNIIIYDLIELFLFLKLM